jgi:DNA-binding GntR family transcriptional regulator
MPDARYLEIVGFYRNRIKTGALVAGARLPPIRDIAKDFSVSRATAQKAVAALSNEGLVHTMGRNGTLVSAITDQETTIVVTLPSPAFEITETTIVRAVDGIAAHLGVPEGTSVVILKAALVRRPAVPRQAPSRAREDVQDAGLFGA